MAGGEARLPEPQSGQGAMECGNVSQTRRMTNLCPRNRVRYSDLTGIIERDGPEIVPDLLSYSQLFKLTARPIAADILGRWGEGMRKGGTTARLAGLCPMISLCQSAQDMLLQLEQIPIYSRQNEARRSG